MKENIPQSANINIRKVPMKKLNIYQKRAIEFKKLQQVKI